MIVIFLMTGWLIDRLVFSWTFIVFRHSYFAVTPFLHMGLKKMPESLRSLISNVLFLLVRREYFIEIMVK